MLAAGSDDHGVYLWHAKTGQLLHMLEGHTNWIFDLAWLTQQHTLHLVAASGDQSICLWDIDTGRTTRILEGHTNSVQCVALTSDQQLLASKGADDTVRLWRTDTWERVAVLPEPASTYWPSGLAFHPHLPLLALVGSDPDARYEARDTLIHIWELDLALLLGTSPQACTAPAAVHHTTAKIVLVGDSGVGKTGLGSRLAHGEFKEHASTHGQQFWVLDALGTRRADGTACEAILWDLAGQPDYRLTHALFLDDADLALVLFDATDSRDPLHGVEFWLKQLHNGRPASCPIILVGARVDRGEARLTQEELEAFCRQRGLSGGYLATSAKDNIGLAEMMTAVGHLANYGYMQVLRTSQGDERLLLLPELLNNLAASFVLEARRNPKGLGTLEEARLLAGDYAFRELDSLTPAERAVLLDAAALLFLEHHICFRETDPLNGKAYLVFPELINLKKPVLDVEQPLEDGAAYTVSGAVENVYASLVVLLGYTQTFTRTDQWRHQARYEVGTGLICGFRQDAERDGELEFVLYFGTTVGQPIRTLFQGLFESFLARRNLSVLRYEPVLCAKGHPLHRAVAQERLRKGTAFAFCPECGDKITLPTANEPIQLTLSEQRQVDEQQWVAAQRSRFEQAVFQVMAYVENQHLARPVCFVSYAWGDRDQERWVERQLATDLQKAGINVVLDRWKNARVGVSVARSVERIAGCDRVLVVGTPLYRRKYENKDSSTGSIVAAEVDVIANRLLSTEAVKETVLPLLLAGQHPEASLPPLLHGRVYADFRQERAYFTTAFDLILDLYQIAHQHPAVADLRESLQDKEWR